MQRNICIDDDDDDDTLIHVKTVIAVYNHQVGTLK